MGNGLDMTSDSNSKQHWTHSLLFWRRSMAPWWGLAIGVAVALLYWPGILSHLPGLSAYRNVKPFRSLDHRIGDLLHAQFAVKSATDDLPKICVVGITSDELQRYGPLPWDRRMHGKLVRRLNALGAGVVAFDIFFPNVTEADGEFAEACEEMGRVILPRWAVFAERAPVSAASVTGGDMIDSGDGGAPVRCSDGVFRQRLREAAHTLYPRARQQGHINIFYDNDLVARRVPVAVGEKEDKRFHLPLGVVAAMASWGIDSSEAVLEERWLNYGGLRIPLDEAGCLLVNYQPFDRCIDTRPAEMRNIEADVHWLGGKGKNALVQFYSYSDVLEGRVPESALKDAIVLVGQCVWGSREDVHTTPYGSQFGVFVQAMLVWSTLSRSFLVPADSWATVATLILVSLILGMICFRVRFRGSAYVVVAGGFCLAAVGLVGTLCVAGFFRRYGMVVDTTPFFMVLGLNFFGGIASSTARETREADRRGLEMEVLLAAGELHATRWLQDDDGESVSVPGAAQMAMSNSITVLSPQIAAETFLHALPCEGCILNLLEDAPSGSEIERVVITGFESERLSDQVMKLLGHFSSMALDAARPLALRKGRHNWVHVNTAPNLKSVLCVPVVVRGATLAVALLCNKRSTEQSPEKEFTESDCRLAGALCYQVGALLENARRYRLEYAMFDGFAQSMAKAVDVRDKYTHGHSERVSRFSAAHCART